MHAQAEPDKFTSIQRILTEGLQKSLEVEASNLVQPAITIPLNRVKSGTQVKYVSALALKQASCGDNALSLAQQMTQNLHQTIQSEQSQPFVDYICRSLEISTAAPGWIYLELSPVALAIWLQHGISSVLIPNQKPGFNNTLYEYKIDSRSSEIFMITYSHARCCSLVRAADGVCGNWRLALVQPDQLGSIWQPAAWQPTEWQLISHCIDAADAIDRLASSSVKPPNFEPLSKLASELSQGFQAFYAACPIGSLINSSMGKTLGKSLGRDSGLLHRRLGLVLLAQKLLHGLLEMLNLPAPEQL
jgi:hypothetical protein